MFFRKKQIIKQEDINEFNYRRVVKDKSVICHSPFNSMLFENDGRVFACCHNYKHLYGTYPVQSIDELWNGKRINSLRKAIREKDLSFGCDVCRFDFESKCYNTVQSLMFDNFPVNSNGFPSMLDLKLDNTCNLECVMCDGMHSSSVRKAKQNMHEIINPYGDDFVKQLEKYIPHLHTIRFSGGEPFLSQVYYRIWENVIKLNPSCVLRVQTNATIMNDRIRELLSRGNFEINVSLDSVNKQTYESIRRRSDFDKAIENTRFFSEYSRERDKFFGITICPQRLNIDELPQIVNFCNSIGAVIWFSNVWLPVQQAVWTLSSVSLKEIHDKLSVIQFPSASQVQRDNSKIFSDFIITLGKWQQNAVERESGEHVVDIEILRRVIKKAIKTFFNTLEIDSKEKKATIKRLQARVENIAGRIDKSVRIPEGYLNGIRENSSIYQLIDMFEETSDEEILDIIRLFGKAKN